MWINYYQIHTLLLLLELCTRSGTAGGRVAAWCSTVSGRYGAASCWNLYVSVPCQQLILSLLFFTGNQVAGLYVCYNCGRLSASNLCYICRNLWQCTECHRRLEDHNYEGTEDVCQVLFVIFRCWKASLMPVLVLVVTVFLIRNGKLRNLAYTFMSSFPS